MSHLVPRLEVRRIPRFFAMAQKISKPAFTFWWRKSSASEPTGVAVVQTTALKRAVDRNRARRRLRSAIQIAFENNGSLPPQLQGVFRPTSKLLALPFSELVQAIEQVKRQIK